MGGVSSCGRGRLTEKEGQAAKWESWPERSPEVVEDNWGFRDESESSVGFGVSCQTSSRGVKSFNVQQTLSRWSFTADVWVIYLIKDWMDAVIILLPLSIINQRRNIVESCFENGALDLKFHIRKRWCPAQRSNVRFTRTNVLPLHQSLKKSHDVIL